jgi:hypothetical protein
LKREIVGARMVAAEETKRPVSPGSMEEIKFFAPVEAVVRDWLEEVIP